MTEKEIIIIFDEIVKHGMSYTAFRLAKFYNIDLSKVTVCNSAQEVLEMIKENQA